MTNAMCPCEPAKGRLDFPGTDLTVFVELTNGELSMTVAKASQSVYRVVVEQAMIPPICSCAATVCSLKSLSADVADDVESLNIAQRFAYAVS